jgi:hypothetical protein
VSNAFGDDISFVWTTFMVDLLTISSAIERGYQLTPQALVLGGISLNAFLSSILFFCSSFSLTANVLLLKPFIALLNLMYRTGSVVQHNGIRISSVPL